MRAASRSEPEDVPGTILRIFAYMGGLAILATVAASLFQAHAVIAAIDRAIALRQQYNIRVINLSVGRPVYESFGIDPLCHAVEKAWANGIVVVVAAGNYGRNDFVGNKGYGTITAPGNDPTVITVGAMKTEGTNSTSDDQIATYSSKGPTMGDHIVKPANVAQLERTIRRVANNGG